MFGVRALIWVVLLVVPGLVFAQKGRVEQVLDLEQSVTRALHNNQKLLAAIEDIRIAESRVKEAQAHYFPKVGVNLSGSRYLAETDYVLPPEFGSTLLPISPRAEADTFYSARAWLRQSLYNGGRVKNTIRLAQANLERARIRREEVRAEVVFNSIKAFYDVLLKQKEISMMQKALSEVISLSQKIPRNKTAALTKVAGIRHNIRRSLAKNRREADRAQLVFLGTLGVELYTRVGVEGEMGSSPAQLDLKKLLAWAHEYRADIRLTGFQKEIDRLAVNLSIAQRYPIISLGAGYQLNDRRFPLENTHWNTTVNVSLPLFDGFSSRARVRLRRREANRGRIKRTEIEDRINREVRDAFGDLMYWQEELVLRENEWRQMEEAIERGKQNGQVVDIVESLVWQVEAQKSLWEAIHGHRVALAKLEKAVGHPLINGQ